MHVQDCVWYTKKVGQNDYVGQCYPFSACPTWMWGTGSTGDATESSNYQWCLSAGQFLAAYDSDVSCFTMRAQYNLSSTYDPYEGPCVASPRFTMNAGTETPT